MPAFDHHTEEFALRWRDIYAALRTDDPVSRTDAHGGYVVVTGYADVREVLLSPDRFACRRELDLGGAGPVLGGVTIPRNPFRMGMMEMDAPESTFFRKLLVPWFSPRTVEAASAHLRDLTTWCLDRVIERGAMDVVDDLANPLPALITLDVLGLPLDKWERYAVALHRAAYREKGSAKQMAWLLDDLRTVLAGRRESPPVIPTPVDALLAAERDGSPLPLEVVVEMVFMLLNGGIDTSTALIAHGLRHLSAHPDQATALRADPGRIPDVVDELLRHYTPGTGVARTVTTDTEIHGCPLRAGEHVFLALGSANTDPAVFEHADVLDIDRDAARHLAFGAGLHRCLGTFLARAEITIVLEEVLRRMPDLRVDDAGVVPYPTIPSVAGFKAMPATFTPGPRLGRADGADGAAVPPARADRLKQAAAMLAVDEVEDETWHPIGHTTTRKGE